MELLQLEYFLAVARELHFRHAAEHLHISQPPLSRRIMELEDELGVKLFERTTRGVSLTPAGEILKEEAHRLLRHSDHVRQRIASMQSEVSRTIRLGLVGSALHSFFPDLVTELEGSRPGLSFELHELGSGEQVKALEAGRLDLGFLRSWAVTGEVHFLPLTEETLSMIYPAELRREGGKEPGLVDLAELPCIAFSDSCAPRLQELADRICARSGFASRKRLVVDHYASVLRYVELGLGWSIVPTQVLTEGRYELGHGTLEEVPERITLGIASRHEESDPTILEIIERTRLHFRNREPPQAPPGDRIADTGSASIGS